MKRISICTIIMSLCVLSCGAQTSREIIKLNAPNLDRGEKIMKAFSERQSIRAYSTKELSLSDLSDLVWAANGINRPEKNGRTAASCLNYQDVDVYVVMKEGAYIYDFKNHALNLLTPGDNRDAVVGGQLFAADAPVLLVLVSDLAHFGGIKNVGGHATAGIDVGIVSGNISVFCAGANLATVPRGTMDGDKLRTILKLRPDQQPMLNHPVGYKK